MSTTQQTEVLFYHLERVRLDDVLPGMLEKSLERGWRVVVQASGDERLEALNTRLWTYREDSFLPHGAQQDGNSEQQPIFLTTDESNPNGADVRFFVDGADADDISAYTRAVYLFDGNDEQAVRQAREQWSLAKGAGHEVTYWRQNERGGWEKKA